MQGPDRLDVQGHGRIFQKIIEKRSSFTAIIQGLSRKNGKENEKLHPAKDPWTLRRVDFAIHGMNNIYTYI